MAEARKRHTVDFLHVKGHSNHQWNDAADTLANRGATGARSSPAGFLTHAPPPPASTELEAEAKAKAEAKAEEAAMVAAAEAAEAARARAAGSLPSGASRKRPIEE